MGQWVSGLVWFIIPESSFLLSWFLFKVRITLCSSDPNKKRNWLVMAKAKNFRLLNSCDLVQNQLWKPGSHGADLVLLYLSSKNSDHNVCIWQTTWYFSTVVPNFYHPQLPTACCSILHSAEHLEVLLNLDVRWQPSRQEPPRGRPGSGFLARPPFPGPG